MINQQLPQGQSWERAIVVTTGTETSDQFFGYQSAAPLTSARCEIRHERQLAILRVGTNL